MHRSRLTPSVAVVVFCLLGVPASGMAQKHTHATSEGTASRVSLGAMAVLVGTQVDPAVRGTTLREMYLSQPMVMLHVRTPNEGVSARVTLNAEGAVMRRGELTPGIYGEGYIDRRHPHTTLHEAMVVAQHTLRSARFSLGVGKGIVPFGSDDPMMRPFQKFPVNHHIAQILERAMVVGAVRYHMLSLEGAVFNGDEPESPGDWPNLDRIGDSWSARATLAPLSGLELSVSSAGVASPEDAGGKGLNQRKKHAAVRYDRGGHHGVQYVLVEYGHTGEYRRARKAWDFSSTLAEVGGATGPLQLAFRYERTTRPDEARTGGDFRSFRPLLDFSILGRSRWDVGTVNISTSSRIATHVTIDPFVEIGLSRVRPTVVPTTFVPSDFYGGSRLWALSLGVRLHAGHMPARMGRYGSGRPEL